jgi:hypothetical protein
MIADGAYEMVTNEEHTAFNDFSMRYNPVHRGIDALMPGNCKDKAAVKVAADILLGFGANKVKSWAELRGLQNIPMK